MFSAAVWSAANPYVITAIASVIAATTAQGINVFFTWLRERNARLRREERMKQIFRSLVWDADIILALIVNEGVMLELEDLAAKISALRLAVQELTPLLDLEPIAIQQLFAFVGNAEVGLSAAKWHMDRYDDTFRPEGQSPFDDSERDRAQRNIRSIFLASLRDAVEALGSLDFENTGGVFERNSKAAIMDPTHPGHTMAKRGEVKRPSG